MPRNKDPWPGLCDLVDEDDGLAVRTTKIWTEDKVRFWSIYVDIVTRAMSGKPQWPGGLAYLDLFAGPGVCQLEETKKRFPGSMLVAANQLRSFSRLIACELDETNATALERRLSKSPVGKQSTVLQGDCNELIEQACELIPNSSLTLAFVDPEGLQAKFETLRKLTTKRSVDLLILFPDSYDIVRNVEGVYAKQERSKLDDVLGTDSNWRSRWEDLPNQTRDNTCNLFCSIYENQLERHLGYKHFRRRVMKIPSKNIRLYTLIYASRHPLGLDFWDKASTGSSQGQKGLGF